MTNPPARLTDAELSAPAHWDELLRVHTMSVGVYRLAAGAKDVQTPHHEDEIYVVRKGRGVLSIAGVDHLAEPGDLLFVAAEEPHHFHSITDELELLVVFAPAETVD